jgi:hypothetical protein
VRFGSEGSAPRKVHLLIPSLASPPSCPALLLATNLQYTPPPHHNSYDYLIVAPGLKTDFNKIPGLLEALQDPSSKVSTIYKEDSVEQVWSDIQQFEGGKAVNCSPAWSAREGRGTMRC